MKERKKNQQTRRMQRYGRFSGIGCPGGLWQLFLYHCFFCCRFQSSCFQRAHHCAHPEIQGRK